MILGKIKSFGRQIISWVTSYAVIYRIGEPFFWLMGLRRKVKKFWLSQVKRVLVVRLDDIGDIVLTTPFLRELRKNLPSAKITLVVDPRVYNLVEICPYVDRVLACDLRIATRFGKLIIYLKALKFAFFHLWKERFDLAILPRWGNDFYNDSLVAYLSGAVNRVAYSENVNPNKHRFNRGCDKLFTHLKLDKSLKHETGHCLEIINFLGGNIEDDSLELWLDRDDEVFARLIMEENNVRNNFFLMGIGPGSPSLRKAWPIERFLELAQWLIKEMDAKIIFFGNANEVCLGRYVEKYSGDKTPGGMINIIGKTTLRQAASILRYCKLYIGNDTGLLHMAAAVNVPVVEVSSWPKSSNDFTYSPWRFCPWKVKHIVVGPKKPISPCEGECIYYYPHCILQVQTQEVKEAAKKLLSELY